MFTNVSESVHGLQFELSSLKCGTSQGRWQSHTLKSTGNISEMVQVSHIVITDQ